MTRPAAATNAEIAATLERVADLLEAQAANRHRVAAYRRGAETIRAHPRSLAELYREGGSKAVDALPTIGPTLAAHVAELVQTGALALQARLEGEVSPEQLFATVPGIGPELARRIHDTLDLETLEDLEQAAHDGRLAVIRGFGPRRIRAIREQLGAQLGRAARLRGRLHAPGPAPDARPAARPAVETILALDAEYRAKAAAGELRLIRPRRFNPRREAWLPILHAERDGWHFTLLFSNTARAHELGRTRDWVVVYYERNGDEGQCTVVDETAPARRGRRTIRGREAECLGSGDVPSEVPGGARGRGLGEKGMVRSRETGCGHRSNTGEPR